MTKVRTMADMDGIKKNFEATFGKPFNEKAYAKIIAKQLLKKEEEYYFNLISHLPESDLLKLSEYLNGKRKGKIVN